MKRIVIMIVALALIATGCFSDPELSAQRRQDDEREKIEIYNQGFNDGMAYAGDGYNEGYDEGYSEGYKDGLDDATNREHYEQTIYDLFDRVLTDEDQWEDFKSTARDWGLKF